MDPTRFFLSESDLALIGSFTGESDLAPMYSYCRTGSRRVLSSSTYFWIPSLDYDPDTDLLY